MSFTNSIIFEHKGDKFSATLIEDITTDPKFLLITPQGADELGDELKFELISGTWQGPEHIRTDFPETYESMLTGIKHAGYEI